MTVIYGEDVGLIQQKLKQLKDSFLEKATLSKEELRCFKTIKDHDVVLTVYSDSPYSAVKSDPAITAIACKKLTAKDMQREIKQTIKDLNLELDEDLVDTLALTLPLNSGVIQQELKKLCLFDKETLKNNPQLVREIICDYEPVPIFKLTDALVRFQHVKVFHYIEELFESKKFTVLQFLEFFANELLLALTAKITPLSQLSRVQTNINPLRLRIVQTQYKNFSIDKLLTIINGIYELDIKIKKNVGLTVPLLKHFVLTFFQF